MTTTPLKRAVGYNKTGLAESARPGSSFDSLLVGKVQNRLFAVQPASVVVIDARALFGIVDCSDTGAFVIVGDIDLKTPVLHFGNPAISGVASDKGAQGSRSSNMGPDFSTNDHSYKCSGHSILDCQFRATDIPLFISCSNSQDLGFIQLGVIVPLTHCSIITISVVLILDILRRSTGVDVVRTNTKRVIAFMKNPKSIGNRTKMNHIRDAVSTPGFPPNLMPAITTLCPSPGRSSPNPTGFRFANLYPKSFNFLVTECHATVSLIHAIIASDCRE